VAVLPPRTSLLLGIGLVVLDVAFGPVSAALPLLSAVLLLLLLRRAPRTVTLLALAVVVLDAALRLHLWIERAHAETRSERRLRARLDALEHRKTELLQALASFADRTSQRPDAPGGLKGDSSARSRLFLSLESLRDEPHPGLRDPPALGIHALPPSLKAWAGPASDLAVLPAADFAQPHEFVLLGSVSTILIATRPIRGPTGTLEGVATAEIAVAVRRNIHNAYLSDFDLLAGSDPDVEIHYVDSRDPAPRGPTLEAGSVPLYSKDTLLATVRLAPVSPAELEREVTGPYRRGLSALALLALIAWSLEGRPRSSRRLLLGATAMRLVLLALGPPIPAPASPLLSPSTYASAFLSNPWFPRASPFFTSLLRSPLDLLFTTAWLLFVAALLARVVVSRPPRPGPFWRALLADLLSLSLIVGILSWIGDTQTNSSVDVEAIFLLPRSPSHLVVQLSALLIAALGATLILALQSLGEGLASRRGALVGRLALLALFVILARKLEIGLPLVPALALLLGCAFLAGRRGEWWPRLVAASPGLKAGLVVVATAVLGLLLYPTLVFFEDRNSRMEIEQNYAPLVLRQPEWREYVLSKTLHKIDSLQVLEEALPGPYRPGLEDLAFAVWSNTDLASFGFSSAIEIQDPQGLVVSRFAVNLPTLAASQRLLPEGEEWAVRKESLPFASTERPVLHAERALSYHGEIHGAIHVYIGDDYWNLPFVTSRYPYSVLFRTTPGGNASRDHTVALLAYNSNREAVFSSVDRPPALSPELAAQVKASGRGLWTTLKVDGRAENAYLFADKEGIYALCSARRGAGRFAADLVEATSGLTLTILLGLGIVVILRTLLGKPSLTLVSLVEAVQRSFSLRLFVAFVALAFIPVAILQVVARGFVADRLAHEVESHALERATIAKKAVEDFAYYEQGQGVPVTDALLVWLSTLMRGDVDVFDEGRLVASSKRELYASGLLPERVPGTVYNALVLEGQPSVLKTDTIGGFHYLVASVPVRLGAPEPRILSIPLTLGQREAESVLDDLDRTIRLASVLFLAAAIALAHSIARRISGPISDLTRATREIAHGNLLSRVEPRSQDELRTLVESFNQMAGDLDRQRRALEQSHRLAAWAEMARQVAHEVKNPLTPIQLSAEHLRRVYEDPSVDFRATLESCTETILKQVRMLREIVTEFSAFARPPASVLVPQDPQEIVKEVLAPYTRALPPGVTFSLDLEKVPSVLVDRRLLERAVVNLLENALQAVGDKGRIEVRLHSKDGRLELEIEDSGPGVDPDIREKIFEPFFSTKTSGSGLGLALVKKISEDHGGGVTLESQPGRTRATLWLPLSAPPPRTA
jgi:signal transduction histidine kinase